MDFISNRANTIAYELKYVYIAMKERGIRGVLTSIKAIAKRQKDIHQLYRLHASFAFQIAMNNELGFQDGLSHLKIAEKSAVKALSLSPKSIEYRLFYVVVRYQKAKLQEELIGNEKKKGGGYLLKRKNLVGEILGIVNDESPQQPNWVNVDRPSFVEYTKNCALSVMNRILAEINQYKAEQAKEKEEGSNSKRKKTQNNNNNNNNRSNKKKKKEKEKGKMEITNPNDPMGCSSTTPAVVPSNLQSAPVTMNPPATDAISDAESTC